MRTILLAAANSSGMSVDLKGAIIELNAFGNYVMMKNGEH